MCYDMQIHAETSADTIYTNKDKRKCCQVAKTLQKPRLNYVCYAAGYQSGLTCQS